MSRFLGKRVVVTGGAGFIGSHLVDALVREGARVRVIDNLSTGHKRNLESVIDEIEFVEMDIRDAAACQSALEDISIVFHQAALGSVPRSISDPATSIDVNVRGTTNVFAAARDCKVSRVVYASSSSVYGDSTRLPKREGEEGALLSPYALSKHVNEETAAVFARCYGLQLIGLRYFNVYGPRQDPNGPYAAVVPRFFDLFSKSERPMIFGDGEQSRDFTFVADAVEANLLAALADKSACGRAYNIGAGSTTSVNQLSEAIRVAAGAAEPALHGPERPGDVRDSLADHSRATEALGWRPSVRLMDGIARTTK